MKFKLRNGPWKTVFDGNFQGHEMEISINPGQTLLVTIYEKDGEEVTGMVVQTFSVYSAVGDIESFVEGLDREAIILSRHDAQKTVQFLAIASSPAYSKASEEEAAKAVDNLISQLDKAGKKIKDVAESFDLKINSLDKCSNSVKQAFFSQPLLIPMLAREKKTLELEKEEANLEETGAEGAAVVLGMTKDGKQVKEPLQMFQRIIVTDGALEQRIRFSQIIIESYLLANTPVIIFDGGNHFEGLSHPSRKRAELQSHGIEIEPIGFPTKEFTPAKNLRANINVLNAAGILELFGSTDEETEKVFAKALEKGGIKSIAGLVNNVNSLGAESADNLFLKMRVERIATLIGEIYPDFFSGENKLEEIAKTWFKKIGRASIVHVGKTDPRALTFILDSLSNEIVNLFKQQGGTGMPRLLIAIPEINPILALRENIIQKDFIKMLTEMQRFGVGFIVGAERRTDLPKELLQISETKAGIIKANDVAIDLPNSKNYRLFIRPTLSTSEKDTQ